ncbi:ABC transporter ATP-binding protein [Bacillus massiliigorillae]|uniref:ABC transporter ATP-binding protein n=1 Tax=Bacillus massiliigorillae TaxID=1243664 RepID=UPI0003AADA4A|nr:ABC transporter ATP-binding protein [Bacillus massiliigorillae]
MIIALQVEQLTKSYGNNQVIKGISFEVERGEIFGLLGTNGAGKTTTLECIEGIRKYDSGTITVSGKMGVQLQSSSLPINIRVIEAITLFCKWNKTSFDMASLHKFGLEELKNRQYKELSTGQKRRLHLALALIGDPDVLFLDEPTAGLDVEGKVSLHNEIRKLKQQGKTIILASHDMAEVESLCDRIAILKDGRIAFTGSANELTLKIGGQCKIHIKTTQPLNIKGLVNCSYAGEKHGYAMFNGTSISDALLELLTLAKRQENIILDIKLERASLEQRFMDIAKEG